MKRIIAFFIMISLLMCVSNAKTVSAKAEIQSTVKDISGTKQKLTIDSVKHVGTKLEEFDFPFEYHQVADGHYYYMRQVKKDQFTIYRDAGKKVGSFKMPNQEWGYEWERGFMRYGSKFYLYTCHDDQRFIRIAVVDFKQKITKTICEIHPTTWGRDLANIEVTIYRNKIYAMNGNAREENKEYKVEKFDMSSGNLLNTFSFPKPGENETMNFINIADGKIYYSKEYLIGKKQIVTFRCRDMSTNKDKKIFRCNLSAKNVSGYNYHYGDNALIMKGKQIYYYGTYASGGYWPNVLVYSIPSVGGKMKQIGKGMIRDFTYNNKYYFYIDNKHRLHRQNRKTHRDKIISGIKVMRVDCTKKGLYVQKYDKWFDGDDASGFEYANVDYAPALYFMNFKGGNAKKIAKATMGHLDYDWYR